MRLALFAILATISTAGEARAQLCRGLPRTDTAPVNFGVSHEQFMRSTSVGARVGVGGAKAFVGVGGSRSAEHYDAIGTMHAVVAEVDGGLIAQGASGRAALCPIFSVSYSGGPNLTSNGLRQTQLQRAAYVGLAGGVKLGASRTLAFIPNGRLLFGKVYDEFAVSDLANVSVTNGSRVLGGGIALLFRQAVALGTDASIDMGAGNPPTRYSVYVTFGIPRHR